MPFETCQAVFAQLQRTPANKHCVDCNAANPTWTSIPFGVFLCLQCSANHRNMGVHLSFVKSATLDQKWTQAQLRHMKCGGNDAIKEYFQKNNSQWGQKQLLEKYDCQLARDYKAKLDKRAAADMQRHPDVLEWDNQAQIDAANLENSESNSASADDFFSKWDNKTAGGKKSSPLASRSVTPSRGSTPPVAAKQPQQPMRKIVAKSSASSGSSSILQKKNILSSGAASRSKAKLQVKKVDDFDFDQLAKEAEEDQKQTKELGYNPKEDASVSSTTSQPKAQPASLFSSREERMKAQENAKQEAASSSPGTAGSGSGSGSRASDPPVQQFARLGFGMTASTAPASAPATAKKYKDVAYTGEVAKRFGTQKGISSDQFHGTGAYDESEAQQARDKLKNFANSQSISSDDYYGNNRAGNEQWKGYGSNCANGANNGDFEDQVIELANKYVGEDLDALKGAIEQGAEKLGGFLRDVMRNA